MAITSLAVTRSSRRSQGEDQGVACPSTAVVRNSSSSKPKSQPMSYRGQPASIRYSRPPCRETLSTPVGRNLVHLCSTITARQPSSASLRQIHPLRRMIRNKRCSSLGRWRSREAKNGHCLPFEACPSDPRSAMYSAATTALCPAIRSVQTRFGVRRSTRKRTTTFCTSRPYLKAGLCRKRDLTMLPMLREMARYRHTNSAKAATFALLLRHLCLSKGDKST